MNGWLTWAAQAGLVSGGCHRLWRTALCDGQGKVWRQIVEIKINETQPIMADPRLMPELSSKKSRVIKPVSKGKGTVSRKVGDDRGARRENADRYESSAGDAAEIVDGVNSCPEAISSCLRQGMDETGESVMELLDPVTGEVLRQIPPTDPAKVGRKLEEVKGLIFDTKI